MLVDRGIHLSQKLSVTLSTVATPKVCEPYGIFVNVFISRQVLKIKSIFKTDFLISEVQSGVQMAFS